MQGDKQVRPRRVRDRHPLEQVVGVRLARRAVLVGAGKRHTDAAALQVGLDAPRHIQGKFVLIIGFVRAALSRTFHPMAGIQTYDFAHRLVLLFPQPHRQIVVHPATAADFFALEIALG